MLYEQTSIAARLITIRKDLKLTQTEFADRIGVPRSTYKNYENGREPSRALLKTLIIQENIDPRWLVTGTAKLLDADDDGVVRDALMLRSAIVTRTTAKGIVLSEDDIATIIIKLIDKRSKGSETDFYDRDYMCRLIREHAAENSRSLDEAAE